MRNELRPASERLQFVLSGTHLLETLSDRQKLKDWITASTYEEFRDTLQGLNALVLRKNSKAGDFSPEQKAVGNPFHLEYLSPEPSQRDKLMQYVHHAFQVVINEDRNKDAGLLLYLAIQMVHPFDDGNGRTGRALYFLLADPATQETANQIGKFINESNT
jgi:Fic family protein